MHPGVPKRKDEGMARTDRLLRAEECEELYEIIRRRGVGVVAHEIGVAWHDVVDAAIGEHVEAAVAEGVRRLLAR